MKWIDAGDSRKPLSRRPVLCYCPEWSDSGYQVAVWNGSKFKYDEDPNGEFNEYVKSWQPFMEAD